MTLNLFSGQHNLGRKTKWKIPFKLITYPITTPSLTSISLIHHLDQIRTIVTSTAAVIMGNLLSASAAVFLGTQPETTPDSVTDGSQDRFQSATTTTIDKSSINTTNLLQNHSDANPSLLQHDDSFSLHGSSRKRKVSWGHNSKLVKPKKCKISSREENLLSSQTSALDEIDIIRQQIIKEGIHPEQIVLPEGQLPQRQSMIHYPTNGQTHPLFSGTVVIKKRLQALESAFSEHQSRDNVPHRSVFWVDASVAPGANRTYTAGVAVVSRSSHSGCDFQWNIKGYRVGGAINIRDVEILAILQALRIACDEANGRIARGSCGEEQTVIIYSDSQDALKNILDYTRPRQESTFLLVDEVITLSATLNSLAVMIELHWVPAHRDVPGNYLADYVARRAWGGDVRFELTLNEEIVCEAYKMGLPEIP